jgi:GNAT superfamily N-acetyltransferase
VITLTPIGDVGSLLAPISLAYREVYEAPADDVASFADTVIKHVARPGFEGRLAWDGDRIVGFAYGFTLRPGQPWRDDMAGHLVRDLADEWLDGHFGLAQFGVVADQRRRSIGGRLHDVLIDGVPHPRSVLTVYEDNAAALAFYTDRGWSELGRGFITRLGHGPYVILGRVLDR